MRSAVYYLQIYLTTQLNKATGILCHIVMYCEQQRLVIHCLSEGVRRYGQRVQFNVHGARADIDECALGFPVSFYSFIWCMTGNDDR